MCDPIYQKFTNYSQNLETTKYSRTDDWKSKLCYIYTIKCYSILRKIETMQLAITWMILDTIVISEVKQTETETE